MIRTGCGSRDTDRGMRTRTRDLTAEHRTPLRVTESGRSRRAGRAGVRPGSGLRRAQYAKVAASPALGRSGLACAATGLGRALVRSGGFPYGVGERFEIVTAGPGGGRAVGETDDLPAARGGQPLAVLSAQVIAVGLSVSRERTENRGRVGVDVRQRRNGGAAARGARTATYRAHGIGRYRTLERAATTRPGVTPPCRGANPATRGPVATRLTCTGTGAYSE